MTGLKKPPYELLDTGLSTDDVPEMRYKPMRLTALVTAVVIGLLVGFGITSLL